MRMSRRAAFQIHHDVDIGTVFTITVSGTFVVPETGTYEIRMHGGGGGGGRGGFLASGYYAGGNGGGGSGEKYVAPLVKGESHTVTIGTGGGGGAWSPIMRNSSPGSSTSFGTYTIAGGGGGGLGGTLGSKSGSLATPGGYGSQYEYPAPYGNGAAGQGDTENPGNTYGDGGLGGTADNGNGANGKNGAVILTLLSY